VTSPRSPAYEPAQRFAGISYGDQCGPSTYNVPVEMVFSGRMMMAVYRSHPTVQPDQFLQMGSPSSIPQALLDAMIRDLPCTLQIVPEDAHQFSFFWLSAKLVGN
jgi:hypothetical protein